VEAIWGRLSLGSDRGGAHTRSEAAETPSHGTRFTRMITTGCIKAAVVTALALGGLALAAPASASTTGATPATVRPAVWNDTGQRFIARSDCLAKGQYHVAEGDAINYSCYMNDYYDMWQLELSVD
jgi:hypothetical protein